MYSNTVKIFAGRRTTALATKIAQSYGSPLGRVEFTDFSDGEFQPSFTESVRGATVYLVQSTYPPVENLFELLMMADAAHRASAYKVVAVIPYFGWARQDRKDKPRVPIGAKLVANLLRAAFVDRVMTMDLHADQIQGFFDIPVDHMYSSSLFVPYIERMNLENVVFATPDIGGAKRSNSYARHFRTPLVMCHKVRTRANEVESMTAIGEVQGKHVILLDDMVDTAGTLTKAANMMADMGALSVRAFAAHAVLSGSAYDRINASKLTELIVTDTIPLDPAADTRKITVLSVADLFADVIRNVSENRSISENFIFS